jgi:hypothetical protein
MQVLHRLSFNSSPQIRLELAAAGIVVGEQGFVTFEVDESDAAWPRIERWIAKRGIVDLIRTTFSEQEIADASWLELIPDWHYGYPQPNEADFGYREATHDLTNYCERCGVGKRQKAPFQVKGEPKWGRRSILQMNWVFDEYFVTPDLWLDVFKPHGIASRPVINTRGAELQTVVQLVTVEEVGIVTDGLATDSPGCSQCGRTKYLPVTRGPFPALSGEPSGGMAKTKEYFGSGASAYRGVVISQALASEMIRRAVRGASLRPVAGNRSGVA